MVLNSPWFDLQGTRADPRRRHRRSSTRSAAASRCARSRAQVTGFYTRSLHRDHEGEWDFDLALEAGRVVRRCTPAGCARSARGHAELHRGPRRPLPGARALLGRHARARRRWARTCTHTTSSSTSRRSGAGPPPLGPHVTYVAVEGARHDVVLSRAEPAGAGLRRDRAGGCDGVRRRAPRVLAMNPVIGLAARPHRRRRRRRSPSPTCRPDARPRPRANAAARPYITRLFGVARDRARRGHPARLRARPGATWSWPGIAVDAADAAAAVARGCAGQVGATPVSPARARWSAVALPGRRPAAPARLRQQLIAGSAREQEHRQRGQAHHHDHTRAARRPGAGGRRSRRAGRRRPSRRAISATTGQSTSATNDEQQRRPRALTSRPARS